MAFGDSYNLLGVRVNATGYADATQRVIQAATQSQSYGVAALAVHGIMVGALDKNYRFRINQFDLVVPDGQPVRWSLNWLYKTKLKSRVYGPELMLWVCRQAAQENLPIYLYGSQPSVLDALVKNLQSQIENLVIAGVQPSFFRSISEDEKAQVIETIHNSQAKICFVGLGCPRQEIWIYEHLNQLNMPMLGVGAAFDFHAGTLAQAPQLLQNLGLEWFFRLLKEPRRLWRRYLFLNPRFLLLLFLQMTGLFTIDPNNSVQPEQERRFG